MKYPVRLLAIDMDGTLLDDDRQLVPRAAQAIQDAIQAGIVVTLASGRTEPSMRPFAQALGLGGPFVCANGAHVLGQDGKELAHHPVPLHARQVLIDYATEHGLHLNGYTRDELLFLSRSSWGDLYESRVRAMTPRIAEPGELLNAPLSKLMLVAEPRQIPVARTYLESKTSPEEIRMTESEPEYLEFLAPEADKSIGVATVARSLGIDARETAAIGDYLNDLEMVRWAGFSGAVANAHPDVKQCAQVIVGSNQEGGVADFIAQILADRI